MANGPVDGHANGGRLGPTRRARISFSGRHLGRFTKAAPVSRRVFSGLRLATARSASFDDDGRSEACKDDPLGRAGPEALPIAGLPCRLGIRAVSPVNERASLEALTIRVMAAVMVGSRQDGPRKAAGNAPVTEMPEPVALVS